MGIKRQSYKTFKAIIVIDVDDLVGACDGRRKTTGGHLLSSGQLSLSGRLPGGKTRRGGGVASNCCIFVVTGYFCLTIFLHNFFFDVKSCCYDNVDEPNV